MDVAILLGPTPTPHNNKASHDITEPTYNYYVPHVWYSLSFSVFIYPSTLQNLNSKVSLFHICIL